VTRNARRYGAEAAIDGEGVIGFVEGEYIVVIDEREAVKVFKDYGKLGHGFRFCGRVEAF
jgi:hypothetical protein